MYHSILNSAIRSACGRLYPNDAVSVAANPKNRGRLKVKKLIFACTPSISGHTKHWYKEWNNWYKNVFHEFQKHKSAGHQTLTIPCLSTPDAVIGAEIAIYETLGFLEENADVEVTFVFDEHIPHNQEHDVWNAYQNVMQKLSKELKSKVHLVKNMTEKVECDTLVCPIARHFDLKHSDVIAKAVCASADNETLAKAA